LLVLGDGDPEHWPPPPKPTTCRVSGCTNAPTERPPTTVYRNYDSVTDQHASRAHGIPIRPMIGEDKNDPMVLCKACKRVCIRHLEAHQAELHATRTNLIAHQARQDAEFEAVKMYKLASESRVIVA
jgi:hypothetical protein